MMCIVTRMTWVLVSLTLCLLALAAAAPVRTTSETLLATWERPELERVVSPDGTGDTYRRNYAFVHCSPDGQSLTYVEREAARERLVINGSPQPWFDALLGGALYRPDGQPMYAARTGKQYVVVFGGNTSPAYDLIKTIAFSHWRPHSVEVMDALWKEEDDDFKSRDRAYDANLTFTPTGTKQVLYVARREGRDRLVIDGREAGVYETIGRIACSPDGTRLALSVQLDGKWRLVLDGRLQPETYDTLAATRGESAFDFSLDGRHFAFQASTGGQSLLVIDGVVHTKNEPALSTLLDKFPKQTFGVLYYEVHTSPVLIEGYRRTHEYIPMGEDTALACLVYDGTQQRLWTDGTFSKPYEEISTLYWCPFADGIACVVKEGEKEFVLSSKGEGARYDKILALKASPNGKRLAYIARRGEAYFAVLDGNESNPQPQIDPYSLAFSPDGAHFAYRIVYEQGYSIVVDGRRSPIYQSPMLPFAFGTAGECAFVTFAGNGQQAVVDGISGLFYDHIFDSRIFFDNQGGYHYFARRGQRIYRVDEIIVSENEILRKSLHP